MPKPSIDRVKGVVSTAGERRNILCLSGGGYRGLFAAMVLSELKKRFRGNILNRFALISGTSIGGIVALALAIGVDVDDICAAMAASGPKIFGKPGRLRRLGRNARALVTAKYAPGPLEDVVRLILGNKADTKLSDLGFPLLVPAVSYTSGAPYILRSRGLAGPNASTATLLEAAMATSAAPTYFPTRAVGEHVLVDGGLIANAPDVVALAEATTLGNMSFDRVHMLSIGTAGKAIQRPGGEGTSTGQLGWVAGKDIIELTLTAQEVLATQVVGDLLRDRYLRLNATPAPEQQKYLALDRADAVATKTLRALAAVEVERAMKADAQRLRSFYV